MKKMFMLLLVTLNVSSVFASRDLETYICKEELSRRDAHKTHYTLKIEELKIVDTNIDLSEEEYLDYIFDVNVTVSLFNPNTGRSKIVKKFKATSTSVDVHYGLESKENGFGFSTYLDELYSSTMTLANSRGVEKEVSMICDREYDLR